MRDNPEAVRKGGGVGIIEYRFAAVAHFRLAAELQKLAEAAYQNGLRATELADAMGTRPISLRIVSQVTVPDNAGPADADI